MLTLGRYVTLVLAAASIIATSGFSSSQTSTGTATQPNSANQKLQAGAAAAADKKKKPKQTAVGKARTDANQKGTPAATTPQSQSEAQTGWLSVPGDFRPIRDEIAEFQKKNPNTPLTCQASSACAMDACASLLGADGKEVGVVNCLTISADDKVTLTYTSKYPGAPDPAYLAIGSKKPPDRIYPIPSVKLPVNREETVSQEQVIGADFCQKNDKCDCTTEYLKPPSAGTVDQCKAHPEQTNAATDWNQNNKVTASVLSADGSEAHEAALRAFGPDTADVSFSAPASFKPAWLILRTGNRSDRFPYVAAQPVAVNNLSYEADNLSSVCDTKAKPNKTAAACTTTADTEPDCFNTDPTHIQVKPLSVGADVGFVAMTDDLLVGRVKARMGEEPNALIVTNTCFQPPKSVIARRSTKPGQNSKLLRVDMTIMDQITARRNYGDRIAKRYIAVTLDVKNPTAKKVQFNKSALYFDVDYVETKPRPPQMGDFYKRIVPYVTFGAYSPEGASSESGVYKLPLAAVREGPNPPHLFRFGLEQNVHHSSVNYLTALGSFDYTTARTDDKLKVLELLGSVAANIATGGLVADRSGEFKAGTSLFSGTFLPGVRGIVLDTSFINRLRSNLVSQTLQETVQVPAQGSESTIVLLPRNGILAFKNAEIPVMVDRVIDVHLEEEVVTPVGEAPVKKGECTPGNNKEQIREALGEPTGVTTEADNTSTFTYSKGPVASASFDAKGILQSCKTRPPSDQLNQATTMAEATQTLSDRSLSSTKLELTDGGTILVDIPGVQTVYRFDSKGSRQPDYSLLFDDIKAQVGLTKEKFEQYLENKALSAGRKEDITKQATGSKAGKLSDSVKYDSPDLKEGWMQVTFKASASQTDKSKLDASSVVDKISFQGAKPKSIQ